MQENNKQIINVIFQFLKISVFALRTLWLNPKMKDIETREELEFLFSEFYKNAKKDKQTGHHFVELDLENHLPIILFNSNNS